MGNGSRLFSAGWRQDGKVGSHSVGRTKGAYTISRWDETGRDRRTGRHIDRGKCPDIGQEYSRDNGQEYGRECLAFLL